MSQTQVSMHGYVCTPYLHDRPSIDLKEEWGRSKNVSDMYFATATFSSDSKPYFSSTSNHYLLATFRDSKKMLNEIKKYNREKISFVFSMKEDLFERDSIENMNFVSVYYLEYGHALEDICDVASAVAKRDQVGKAGIGHMDMFAITPQKFTFPFGDSIVVLEVSSQKNHQSVNKYCEKTRRDVSRKGITMTNLVSLSILEKLK